MDGKNEPSDVTGEMLGMLGAPMGGGWWLIAIAITSGTNLLDFFAAAQPDAARTSFFAVAALIRIVAVFWLGYALLRRLADVPAPWKPTLALGRFALFGLGIIVAMVLAGLLAALITGVDARAISTGIVTFLLMTLFAILIIRLYAWQAALAVGDRSLGPRRIWRALSGVTGSLIAAYLIVAVVAAVHSVLTRLAIASADSSLTLILLALLDGLVSALQMVLMAGLSVTAWRIAKARAGALREPQAVA